MRTKANRWFMAGTIAGALGMGLGMGLSSGNAPRQLKKARRDVAHMTARATRQAGDFIGGLGQNLADRMR